MNHKPFSRVGDQKPVETHLLPANKLPSDRADGVLSADEVSRAAYFIYLNQGSQPGYDIQHWEEAKRQLRQERQAASTPLIF